MAETNKAGRRHGGGRGAPRVPAAKSILVSIQTGSAISGVPATTLRDLILRGHLPAVRFPDSKRIWIRRADLEALIERSTERA